MRGSIWKKFKIKTKNIYKSLNWRKTYCKFCGDKLSDPKEIMCKKQECLRTGLQLITDEFNCVKNSIRRNSKNKIPHKKNCEADQHTLERAKSWIDKYDPF